MDCKNILALQLFPMDYNLCSNLFYLEPVQIMCSELFWGDFLKFYPIPSELEILGVGTMDLYFYMYQVTLRYELIKCHLLGNLCSWTMAQPSLSFLSHHLPLLNYPKMSRQSKFYPNSFIPKMQFRNNK